MALVLFTLGSAFAVYEGIEKIRHPHEVDSLQIAVGILIVGILLEGGSFRTAVAEARPARGELSWWQFIRRSRAPELPVVLLEDFGALIGLVIALAAVSVSALTGEPVWDGIGTVTIGVLLGVIAVVLAVETRSLLLGESAAPTVDAAIRAAITANADVDGLIHMRTQHMGPDELLIGVKVALAPTLPMERVAEVIDTIEADIRAATPAAHLVYVEPDLRHQTGGG